MPGRSADALPAVPAIPFSLGFHTRPEADAFVAKPDAGKLAEVIKALLKFSTGGKRGENADGEGRRFTEEEADRLRHRRVRLVVEFSDIPQGTAGRIITKEEIEPGGFDVLVAWDEPASKLYSHDRFTRQEFESCLVEA